MAEKTIAAISTATGEAGIGIVRMSGEKSFDIAKEVFRNFKKEQVNKFENRKMNYGYIFNNEEMIDEVLMVYMKGPKTYTREDIVEIYCHGGYIAVKKVLDTLLKKGAYIAERGEFTKRAFLNGRLDLSQAEAVIDLIDAKTDKSYEASLLQLKGSVASKVKKIKEKMLDLMARVEFSINFMEDYEDDLPVEPIYEKSEVIVNELNTLINSANQGRIIKEGIKTAIIGKPNVGKSSLLNALLKENRAIVTDVAGTTRDTIEESIDLGGVSVNIIDTAGIRSTDDIVESIGVEKSLKITAESDLVIAIFDVSKPFDDEDEKIIELLNNKKSIILLNKHDLEVKADKTLIYEKFDKNNIIEMSIIEDKGIQELEDAILDMFFDGEIQVNNTIMITNIRHRDLLVKARDNIISAVEGIKMGMPLDATEIDFRNAYTQLGEITGETIEEDVLDKIFKDFCIGK
ncbi:tRNA uridine-5-carboxymethylaminomethyl(34) synthesis GTPase MnmE [Helcococcus kunzii]|uniref:tRNA uridine-5-carboxymethylaminomethyl(34) synthesis GTPase MnmE n=1 Tax=Helcococcus kunzii TaxID=40091 RepID=UPI0021A3EAEB|nr:tRNA uridine-5-carboxymethylaminomethyl(34) synthesis GTPase MnmE [Helcococcus kunzii]MCT1796848.1 tRNA uridine-5-carboxymethylaminomethyl(34) synthesis GTPase MnmE [Helcococcus kunzii]MCT1988406.1 tRNA uridine-5-carboxymethylaminomethyl(34) synthesis GTPase MnmE [Helcococcus kunzii]